MRREDGKTSLEIILILVITIIMRKEDIAAAFEQAKKETKIPTLIEFIIDPEELVYPMVKPNGTLEDMIMDC